MKQVVTSLFRPVTPRIPVLLSAIAGLVMALILWTAPASACGPYCDMKGGDKSAHYMNNAAACEATCDRTPDCRGWTWVKPGVQGPQAVCYIKNRLMPAQRSNCCISGYRGDRSAANSMRQFRFDVGQKEALPPAVASPPPAARQPGCANPRAVCINARGQRYGLNNDILGQGYCNQGDRMEYVCQ